MKWVHDDVILTVCCGQKVCKSPACLVNYLRKSWCRFCQVQLVDGEPQFDTQSLGELMMRMQLRDAAAIPRGQALPSMVKVVSPLWETLRMLEVSDRTNWCHPMPTL